MDIAVLSDIHGNFVALNRCLEFAHGRGIFDFIFLGDYIGELAYPHKTMQLLYDLNNTDKCYFVKGNKEDYMLNYRANGEMGWKNNDSTTGSLLYTYSSLAEKDMDFFSHLKSSLEISLKDAPTITICHGSPYKTNEKLLPDNEKTFKILDSLSTPIVLCGHTHVQVKINHNNKCVLNCGSVGVPLQSDGKTQFMILHNENGKLFEEFISLEYDVDAVIQDMHDERLNERAPYWSFITEHLLREGKISHGKVLSRAMELCREKTGTCRWPDIPESCWEQAANEMFA